MKMTQLRNEDQDNRTWKTMTAVKRRADCQAWNLHTDMVLVSMRSLKDQSKDGSAYIYTYLT